MGATPVTIERLHLICGTCGIAIILGHKSLEPHFGERIHETMDALATGEVDLKCGACATAAAAGTPVVS